MTDNRLVRFLLRAARLLVLLLVPRLLLAAPPTFFNTILPDGADPWVIRHSDGYYYMTVTTGGNITLWRSRNLSGLGGGEKKVVWRPPSGGPSSKNLWAPELHPVDGKWYVYFAADDGRNENHRMFVLENQNPDPFDGQFDERGKVHDRHSDKWAIDGTLLSANKKLFFIWSGWEGDNNVAQNLYIAPMSDPMTISGPRVEISKPRLPWEKVGEPHVNEGPQVIVRNNVVNVIYSASGSWTDDYCLGLLTAKLDSNLLSPMSWKKLDQPIFRRGNGVRGPGHASFVKSPDGKEDWIVYHAARFAGAGWTRNVRTQPFSWQKNGLPNFGMPVNPNIAIEIPSGDPSHVRYEAENAKMGGVARIAQHASASRGTKVGHIDTPESHVEFTVQATSAGKHIVSVRFGNGTSENRAANHRVSVNDMAMGELKYPNSGWDNWSNAFLVIELKKGSNKIRFSNGDHFAEIDCLDVFSYEK